MSGEGPWLNKAVYKKIYISLDRDGFVAIIPEFDLVDAARLMDRFFDLYEKASNKTAIINLELCGGIQVLLSDSVKPPVPDHVKVSNKIKDKQQKYKQNYGQAKVAAKQCGGGSKNGNILNSLRGRRRLFLLVPSSRLWNVFQEV